MITLALFLVFFVVGFVATAVVDTLGRHMWLNYTRRQYGLAPQRLERVRVRR